MKETISMENSAEVKYWVDKCSNVFHLMVMASERNILVYEGDVDVIIKQVLSSDKINLEEVQRYFDENLIAVATEAGVIVRDKIAKLVVELANLASKEERIMKIVETAFSPEELLLFVKKYELVLDISQDEFFDLVSIFESLIKSKRMGMIDIDALMLGRITSKYNFQEVISKMVDNISH